MRQKLLAGSAMLWGAAAGAQTVADPGEIVVTGSRAGGRAVLDAAAPIDLVRRDRIEATGFPDLGRALNFLQPSINFARAATTATAANTKSITLRGLAPDQVLVLVNGKRRHATAVLNVNNSIGRGSAGVDLDTIPTSAIARIEILRDGAAAQYGSDAIAGVVNIILRSDAQGVSAALQGSITGEGDGESGLGTVTLGLPLGAGGHLTMTGQYRREAPTNRALVDQRFGRVTYRIGDPETSNINFAVDAAVPVGDGEIYGFGTITRKISSNAAGFRVPGFSLAQPNGFLPIITPRITDIAATVGFRTTFGSDFAFDVSLGWGSTEARFGVTETANVSLGATSPGSFDAGAVRYQQFVTDATLSRPIALLAGGNLAVGGQFRHEAYRIVSGEPLAYQGLGADGFSGFNPRNPTDQARDAWAVFGDAELRPIKALLLTGAVRYDHYADFGGKATWRAGARFDPVAGMGLRATISTGFKAPSLQQQYFSAVQGATSAGVLVTVGTLPVSDPAAVALGATPLKPERSTNHSVGMVLAPTSRLSVTADYFSIRIRDRIALSEQLSGAAVTAVLRAAGITNFQQARFFTNAVDTTTKGVEITASWRPDLGSGAQLALTAGYGLFDTRLDTLRPNPVLPSLPLLGARSLLLLTKGQPEDKVTFSVDLAVGRFGALVNVVAFGRYTGRPLFNDQVFGAKTTTDLTLRYAISEGIDISAGMQNLFDVRPDGFAENNLAIAATGGSFPTGEETPISANGRSFFARASARF